MRRGLPGKRWCSEPVLGEDVNPCQHAARLALVDGHGSDAPALSAPARLGIAHRGCDDRELVPPELLRDADGHSLNDEVNGRVVQGLRRRLAHLDLEARGAQSSPQIGGELGFGALAVIDDDARPVNVAILARSPRSSPVAATAGFERWHEHSSRWMRRQPTSVSR